MIDIEKAYKDIAFRASPLFELPLKDVYEYCCEEYRSRLCKMWEYHLEDSFWMGDVIGNSLFIGDWIWAMDMTQIIYCVEHNVSVESMLEYQSFVEDDLSAGRNFPRINFYHWMKGARPEILKDNAEHTED